MSIIFLSAIYDIAHFLRRSQKKERLQGFYTWHSWNIQGWNKEIFMKRWLTYVWWPLKFSYSSYNCKIWVENPFLGKLYDLNLIFMFFFEQNLLRYCQRRTFRKNSAQIFPRILKADILLRKGSHFLVMVYKFDFKLNLNAQKL